MTKNPYLTALCETAARCQTALGELNNANYEMQDLRKKLDPELIPLYSDGEKPFEEACRKAVERFDAAEKAFLEATAKKDELKSLLRC